MSRRMRAAPQVLMSSTPVFTCEVTVGISDGLHLKPCSEIVKVAQKYGCELWIHKADRTVDGTSMLDLITLAAEHGAVLKLETRGERAAEALAALEQLFATNFQTDGTS
jgi:phosphocarrier protein